VGSNCLNAARDLPRELYLALSEAMNGKSGFVWVPTPRNANRQDRNGHVMQLCDEGLTAQAIADNLCLSLRTIRRIIAKERASAGGSGRERRPRRPRRRPDR